MTSFHIKIVPTSNESILKFVANQFLTNAQSYEFKNIEEAKPSPLAQQLFHLPFVKTVYIAQNFVAIEKYNIVDWKDVETEVAEQVENYLNSGEPLFTETQAKKKVPVTVYAESTPNPGVLKFVANKPLVEGTFEFKSIEATKNAPLAQALFHFPFVKEVFFSANYISVGKYDIVEWQEITHEVREFIRKYIEEDKPILNDAFLQETDTPENGEAATAPQAETLDTFSQQIVSLLDEYVKPAVASDGGNIAFQSYDETSKTVRVVLQGACSGCPSSTMTLKNGIETMLREMLNDTQLQVEAING